jgi:predicted transcriptional regulator
MTLTIGEQTIELPPRLQATLEADAKAQARPVAAVLTDRLATLYTKVDSGEVDLAEVAAIQEGFDDLNAGRTISLEEFVAQGQTERAARRAAGA